MPDLPSVLGVVGAGTMGAGIAQLGAMAGMKTILHDPFADALERGAAGIGKNLDKGAARNRWTAEEAQAAKERLTTTAEVGGLADCQLVIEAAPERMEIKRELFQNLSDVCAPETVIGTNTSSIPVTALASAAARPENVVGMHFFNPAPLMRLLEVIAADQTGERALAMARATGEAMGKTVIVAADGPGFLVNRCGRPFYTEALKLLQERVATHEQIDRICRMGAGFRMGPFELMDLVGIDVGFAVAQSFEALSFGEPRWRPNPIQARMVAAGRLGRKSGRGYYDYSGEGSHRPDDPEPPAIGGGDGRPLHVAGHSSLASLIRERAAQAGYSLVDQRDGEPAPLMVDLTNAKGDDSPRLVGCTAASLLTLGGGWSCGFNLVPPLESAKLVELAKLPSTPEETVRAAETFFGSLGLVCEWVEDAPGLVLGRIVAQLVNEACFAVGEGVGTPDDVDTGLSVGLNHPRGPMEWATEIGFDSVLATIEALWEERREERYRPAPLLRRLAAGSA